MGVKGNTKKILCPGEIQALCRREGRVCIFPEFFICLGSSSGITCVRSF